MAGELERTKRGLDPAVAIELGDLFHSLSHDKKTRKIIAKAVKDAMPDSPYAAQFADIEQAERQEEFERQQEAKELKRQQEAAVAAMNAQRARLLGGEAGRKYTEEQIKDIEKLMAEKGIVNYDDGAVIYSHLQPPSDPQPSKDTPVHGSTWEFPEWSKYGKDPVGASRAVANQVITEFMKARR